MPRKPQTYRVEYYTDAAGQHRYRVLAANGNIVLDCAEGYKRESAARKSFRNFVDACADGRLMEVVIGRRT